MSFAPCVISNAARLCAEAICGTHALRFVLNHLSYPGSQSDNTVLRFRGCSCLHGDRPFSSCYISMLKYEENVCCIVVAGP